MSLAPNSPAPFRTPSGLANNAQRLAQVMGALIPAGLVICLWIVLASLGIGATYLIVRIIVWAIARVFAALGV